MSFLLRCAFVVVVVLGATPTSPAAAPPVSLSPVDAPRVKALLHKLDADSFHTRQKADDALRSLGKVVLPLLNEELERTTSLEVRCRLRRMVHDLTIDERIPGLVKMLGHDNASFGEQAEYALREAGPAVVPLLRKELRPTLDAGRRKRLEKIIAELSAGPR